MPAERFVIRQPLTLDSVERDDARVRVIVQTDVGRQHEIVFVFDDEWEAGQQWIQLDEWRRAATPLTYVKGAATGALIDDAELLRRALA